MAEKKEASIVIRKIKKGHAGAHGGSWKVAYADFVTAMMAFFLLLWLLSMVSPEKRIVMAEYFKDFNLFKEGSGSIIPGAGKGLLSAPGMLMKNQNQPAPQDNKNKTMELALKNLTPEQVKNKVEAAINEKFMKLKDQIQLDSFEGGIRIQIIDNAGGVIFQPGSAELTDKAKEILAVISESIQETTNRIAVEGHTDSLPFTTTGVSNWEMSTMRASSARKELQKDGIDPYRIARVVGYADTDPYVKSDPRDARNRRISLILLYEKTVQENAPAKKVPELGTSNTP
jgi:chemotaxis protein MotB